MKLNKNVALFGTASVLATTLLGAGTAFAAEQDNTYNPDPAETNTPVNAKFKLPDDGGSNEKPTDPEGPSNPDGNKPNNPKGSFGIAYQPALWQTPDFDGEGVTLAENGEQEIQFTSDDSRVGVKDKTRQDFGWTLKAKLLWDGVQLPGSTITTQNADGKVQINKGDAPYVNTDAVTGAKNLEINNTDKVVMTGTQGKQHNATYDYQLKNASLKIADAGAVEEGIYNGHVQWTLAKTV